MTITWLVWRATTVHAVFTQIDPNMRIEMSWFELGPDDFTPDSHEGKILLEEFRAEAGWAKPPICTIKKEVISANGASGPKLYIISMSQDQFTAFRQAAMSHGAEQIAPPENDVVVPLWWNPPKVESLRWDYGRAHATYDSERQLLFFRNYRLPSEKSIPYP
jgi:hypothetical protein